MTTTSTSAIDSALSAGSAPAAPGPARGAGAACLPTGGLVLALGVAAALVMLAPPAGRLALDGSSTWVGARLQALCNRPGATPTDLDSAICPSLLRPRSSVRLRA